MTPCPSRPSFCEGPMIDAVSPSFSETVSKPCTILIRPPGAKIMQPSDSHGGLTLRKQGRTLVFVQRRLKTTMPVQLSNCAAVGVSWRVCETTHTFPEICTYVHSRYVANSEPHRLQTTRTLLILFSSRHRCKDHNTTGTYLDAHLEPDSLSSSG